MGGKNCCVVGCGANKARHRGLSFHKIPEKGKTSDGDLWRQKLLSVISRGDKGFNPNTAHICSRHFENDCFEPYGPSRTLKKFSMPTKFMPQKSIITPPTKQSKEPTPREPPALPQIVTYYNFDELKKDVLKLAECMPMWALQFHPTEILLSLADNSIVKLCVSVTAELKNTVTIRGKHYSYPENAVEVSGIQSVLTDMQDLKLCPGVTCVELQKYCEAKHTELSDNDKYYREVHLVNSKMTSTIYSTLCLLESQSAIMCQKCAEVKRWLTRKKERATVIKPISQYTSLSKLQPSSLISLLKSSRQENKSLQAKLQKML